jgi:hypothetical protein
MPQYSSPTQYTAQQGSPNSLSCAVRGPEAKQCLASMHGSSAHFAPQRISNACGMHRTVLTYRTHHGHITCPQAQQGSAHPVPLSPEQDLEQPTAAEAAHHHHHVTQSSHSINAIGPTPLCRGSTRGRGVRPQHTSPGKGASSSSTAETGSSRTEDNSSAT